MKKVIHKAETVAGEWHKMTPHLPSSGQKWLSENIWWIVGIGAIVSLIAFILSTGTLIRVLTPETAYGFVLVKTYTGQIVASTLINMLFIGATAALLFAAIKPLQFLEKKGWVLTFVATLVVAGSVLINSLISLISLNIASFITTLLIGAIFVALQAYFLFEIRSKFGRAAKRTEKE